MTRALKTAALIAVATLCTAVPLGAHKPVTSKYTFSEDVYPIVNAQCGNCHVPGGIAPMSLMTFEDARPWAESIRLELAAGRMPPWFGNPAVAPLRDIHTLSPRDLDVVLTWATGGTPPGPSTLRQAQGRPEQRRGATSSGQARMKTAASTARRVWPRGRPDIVLPMAAAATVPADKTEDTQEFVLRATTDRDRLIAFADLLPGNPAIVHDATIFTRRAAGEPPLAVLATWLPGTTPSAAGPGLGFAWRAGEQLVARIHYKKNWTLENKAASDRSTIGLYLTKPPVVREIRSVGLEAGAPHVLDEHVQALAVRADEPPPSDVQVTVEAVRPDGMRVPLAAFLTRSGWNQRYWFARPVDLPKGTRLDVRTLGVPARPFRLWVDVISAASQPGAVLGFRQ